MRGVVLATLLSLMAASPAAADPATLTEGQVLRGRFVQERHLQGFSQPLRSEGDFVLVPGKGLIWRAEIPFPVTTVVTPAGLVQSVAGQETTRLPAARLPFLSRLYAMMGGAMAGDWSALDGEFTVARRQDGKTLRVTLSPRRNGDPAAAALKEIDAQVGRFVEAVDLVKPGGDFDHLVFSGQALTTGAPTDAEAAALAAAGK
ncbi:MAG: hypothetical protein M0006_01725 [Magnetospirillum sp.]|nr:hypothetical protein [Magnetospirillum sp.]